MPTRSIGLTDKELEMLLIIRQIIAEADKHGRDVDIVIQKRGGHLRTCKVGMPERLPRDVARRVRGVL